MYRILGFNLIFNTNCVLQIKKHAFSGGRDTKEEHRKFGGDTSTDVSYQYLSFFMEDDDRLLEIKRVHNCAYVLSG